MVWYTRVLEGIKATVPFLNVSQTINLALLVSAILSKRCLNLSELARAYPVPELRRGENPKHCLLHRLKRLWRFLDNDRVDSIAVQAAIIPHTIARLRNPRWLGLAIDWTMFDTVTPTGKRVRYQVLRIAVPRRGRNERGQSPSLAALPLLQVAYDRDNLPAPKSQNRLEEALLAVVDALPAGVRAVILADRGFARANFFAFLKAHGLDYVVRIDKGTCMTEADGRRWKLGEEGTRRGEIRDAKSRFGLAAVQVSTPDRLTRLLVALTIALSWLTLIALPEIGALPKNWHAAVSQRGRASVITIALCLLDRLQNLPHACLPSTLFKGGYA